MMNAGAGPSGVITGPGMSASLNNDIRDVTDNDAPTSAFDILEAAFAPGP